jgi:magnesium chelatase subunit I
MSTHRFIHILPYSQIVGQEKLKLALELTYIAPRIGGVLLSGQRGTGKSTAVRAFCFMMYGRLPVTLPINATEDRVVGGWHIKNLMRGRAVPQVGLLEEANEGVLFIDEVNLLDDHIVNIILDVAATGVLVVQREGMREEKQVAFTLAGTMNPEEGGLRPQLLDRFGLVVTVRAETDETLRARILATVLHFDRAMRDLNREQSSPWLATAQAEDERRRTELAEAQARFDGVALSEDLALMCVKVAKEFNAEGHRADYVMALAARANAALGRELQVVPNDLRAVAPMALQHRRPEVLQRGRELWSQEDDERLAAILDHA